MHVSRDTDSLYIYYTTNFTIVIICLADSEIGGPIGSVLVYINRRTRSRIDSHLWLQDGTNFLIASTNDFLCFELCKPQL